MKRIAVLRVGIAARERGVERAPIWFVSDGDFTRVGREVVAIDGPSRLVYSEQAWRVTRVDGGIEEFHVWLETNAAITVDGKVIE